MSTEKISGEERFPVNSLEYWNARFGSGDWRERSGNHQTQFFGKVLLSLMPSWLCNDIFERSMSICDWGCAEGQITHLLKEKFRSSDVTGIDVSSHAIAKAKELFPECIFRQENWLDLTEVDSTYDVIIASNILEHFDAPIEVLRNVLFQRARNYVALLVPYNEPVENMDEEHASRFVSESVPLNFIAEGWHCVFFDVKNTKKCSDTQWQGNQALVVYSARTHLMELKKWWPNMSDVEGEKKELQDDLHQLSEDYKTLQGQFSKLQSEHTRLQSQFSQLQSEHTRLQSEHTQLQSEHTQFEENYSSALRRVITIIKQYENHTSIRIAKLLQIIRHPEIVGVKSLCMALAVVLRAKIMKRPLAVDYSPFKPILQEVFQMVPAERSQACEPLKPLSVYGPHEYQRLLQERLPGRKGIFVHAFSIDWDLPLFSRPQHMCMAMRDCGYLVIYIDFKEKEGFLEIQDNLFIAGGNWAWDLICNDVQDAIISIYSTSPWWGERTDSIPKLQGRNNTILYEYIDHIDPKISGEKVKELSKLFRCVKDGKSKHLFVGSAKMLYDELIEEIPGDRVALVPNGVDLKHYIKAMQDPNPRQHLSRLMKNILDKGRPIVGYFGALAHWLDYELLKGVIESKPEYDFVFIGPDYYGGSSLLPSHLPNCHWLGVVHYDELPYYALNFDVAIIPFERGDVAKSTSPLKLFEYFALEKPVAVTADLLECRVYPEVFVAETRDEFCDVIDKALEQSKNPDFREKVRQLALQNTWQCRAHVLDEFIREHVGPK